MAGKGWQREFDDPITTPDGKRLKTLREAVRLSIDPLHHLILNAFWDLLFFKKSA